MVRRKLTALMAHLDGNSFSLDYRILPLNVRKHFTQHAQCCMPMCEEPHWKKMAGRVGSLDCAQGHFHWMCEYGNRRFMYSRWGVQLMMVSLLVSWSICVASSHPSLSGCVQCASAKHHETQPCSEQSPDATTTLSACLGTMLAWAVAPA